MTKYETTSPITESIATNGVTTITPWEEGRAQLERAEKFWLATVHPNGHPHVVPIFTVWFEGSLYFTANEHSRKAKDLAQEPHCVISTAGETLDLIVEGEAVKIRDEATLQKIAAVYAAKYGWPITVKNGAYDAPYAAPPAGLPPYELYKVHLSKVFGIGGSEPYGATRWRFL